MICALMHPMHDDYDLRQEQLNKSSLLQTKPFLESLLNMWTTHIVSTVNLEIYIIFVGIFSLRHKEREH